MDRPIEEAQWPRRSPQERRASCPEPLGAPSGAQTLGTAERVSLSVLLCLWYLKFASPDESSGTSPVMQPCSRQHAGTSAHLRCQVGRRCVRYGEVCLGSGLRMQGRHTASAQPQPQWSRPRPQPQPRPRPQPQPRPQARTSQALLGRWATQGYPRAVLRRSCARYAGGRRAHTRAHAARLHAGSVSTQVLTRGATAGCTASRAQHCRPTLHVRRGEWAALARLNGSTACCNPGLGGGGAPWSERVEQPRPNAVPCTFQALQHAGRAGEAAQDAAGHRGADDKGEVASEVAVVLRDEAAVLEAGVQLHCEVLGEDERLGGRQDRYDRPARNI